MKKLKCKKCGGEHEEASFATNSETGQKIIIEIERLPFGLCKECFMQEFADNPEMLEKKLPAEITAIAMESIAAALLKMATEESEPGDEPMSVFEYQCPGCGAKAKGLGTKEQYEESMKQKPVCPECQKERSTRETAGEEQSFSM